MAARIGCDVVDAVSRKTTILVVGDQDVRRVDATGKSSKHRKAESFIAAGARLRILSETDFKAMASPGREKTRAWKSSI